MFAWSFFDLKTVKIYKNFSFIACVLFFLVILAPVFVAT